MACPDDPEAERPRNYIESISGDASWDNHGIVIKWTEPIVPGSIRLSLNEPVRLRLCVETKNDLQVPPEDLTAWCWTPIITDVCIIFVHWRSRGRIGKRRVRGDGQHIFSTLWRWATFSERGNKLRYRPGSFNSTPMIHFFSLIFIVFKRSIYVIVNTVAKVYLS